MDQSDIEQLTAIFAKLGYDVSITKRKTKETEEKKEEIIPKKPRTDEKKMTMNSNVCQYTCQFRSKTISACVGWRRRESPHNVLELDWMAKKFALVTTKR